MADYFSAVDSREHSFYPSYPRNSWLHRTLYLDFSTRYRHQSSSLSPAWARVECFKRPRGDFSLNRKSEIVPIAPFVADLVGVETNGEGRAVRQVTENTGYRRCGGVFKHREQSSRSKHAVLVNDKGK